MTELMKKRAGGPSITTKMILTTIVLILGIVVGFGVLNVINIRKVFDESTAKQITVFREGREQLGEFVTPPFARAVEQLLIDRGRDTDIFTLTQSTVAQDTKDVGGKKDYGLKVAMVLDLNQKVIVHCLEEGVLTCVDGAHAPLSEKFGQLTTDAWAQALAAWKAAGETGNMLARFEVTVGKSRFQFFAMPVFVGEVPTAKGALAEEPPTGRQGYVMLGYDLEPIDWFSTTAAELKSAAASKAAITTGAIGALFVLVGAFLSIFQALRISKPIKALAQKADQIARGDLAARVEIKSTDEIGLLGENFNFMADQMLVLLQQTTENAKIEQQLAVAKTIQDTLVPLPDLTEHGILQFAAHFEPAAQTGGDWWTWHELKNGKILMVVGDVTGHGVPSAMITAAAKAACDVARAVHNDDVGVAQLLEIMNYAIYENAKRKFVMTCFASIIDPQKRNITYANAGHNFPYLFRKGEDGKGEFGSLMIRGNRLGDVRESKYEIKTTELLAGDVLIWYTDGIVECESATGEEYGEKRFRASVRRAAALDAAEMRDAIVADANEFYGTIPRKDDITMIVGRIQ
ncbi:MAG: SpoIIE family protein phosphatase [Kofleriaceae bacterium]|nr:SpoIIE family protein phosphatase [Kofleriaceae bacterium]